MRDKAEILEWEARWSLPAGVMALVGVALVIASFLAIGDVSGDGEAAVMRSAYQHASSITISSLLQAGGFVLLVAPLVVLFRATAARSDKVRYQLIGLVVAAPLFLSAGAVVNGIASNDAATAFVNKEAKPASLKKAAESCQSEREDKGAREFQEDAGGHTPETAMKLCTTKKVADETAVNAVSEAPTRNLGIGLGLGGRLGLAITLLYTCLYAMRTGLLTRFWGSLGMALGVAALLLLVQFTMIWFIYVGFLLLGRLPGGRPPAWAAGESIPWPTPGEKAAASIEATEPPGDGEDGERRKRKQRD